MLVQDSVQKAQSLSNAIANDLRDICIQIYLGHHVHLSGSQDYYIPNMPFAIYRCSIGTESVYEEIFDIIVPKYRLLGSRY